MIKINDYVKGDVFNYFSQIDSKSVDLVFTSPPDISQTDFGKNTENYQKFQEKAVNEMCRIVKDNGFIVICQTDRKINAEVLCNHHTYLTSILNNQLTLKDYKIVVRNEIGKKDMYHFTFQHMLVCTRKGTFKRHGEFLKDILIDKQEMVHNQSVWSQDFCKLVIENLTKENDLVIDPFCGVAPVLKAAKDLNRNYWGCEISEDYYTPEVLCQVSLLQ